MSSNHIEIDGEFTELPVGEPVSETAAAKKRKIGGKNSRGMTLLVVIAVIAVLVGLITAVWSIFGSSSPQQNSTSSGKVNAKNMQSFKTIPAKPTETDEYTRQIDAYNKTESEAAVEGFVDAGKTSAWHPSPTKDDIIDRPLNTPTPPPTSIVTPPPSSTSKAQTGQRTNQQASLSDQQRLERAKAVSRIFSVETRSSVSAAVVYDNSKDSDNKGSTSTNAMSGSKQQATLATPVAANTSTSTSATKTAGKVLYEGAHYYYATAEIALNSDYPGPVILNLYNPTGDPALDDAKLKSPGFAVNELGDRMQLHFDTLQLKDGTEIKVNAYGLDPQTGYYAMATDVDKHYIKRFGGWGTGVLLSGLAKVADLRAQSNSSTTSTTTSTTTTGGNVDGTTQAFAFLGTTGAELANYLKGLRDTAPTITVKQHEDVTVLFYDPVVQ